MKKAPLEKIASSFLDRTFQTAVLGQSIGRRLATGRIKRLFGVDQNNEEMERIALLLKDELGRLKGLGMKLGQAMSYIDSGLPESARKILRSLQDSSEPMIPAVIREVFKEDFGRYPEEIFAEWNPTPLAAASIGQVHLATTKEGLRVAVKVQYPEISKALDSDFRSLKSFAKLVDRLLPNLNYFGSTEELSHRLSEECDYRKELAHQTEFRKILSTQPHVYIPAPIPAVCSARVLTTEHVEGLRFAEFQKTASQVEKNQAARWIFEASQVTLWEHALINADPHPGNFLFAEDKVILLDFGCVRRWDEKFLERERRFFTALLENNRKDFEIVYAELWLAKTEGYNFAAAFEASKNLTSPLLQDREFSFKQLDLYKGLYDVIDLRRGRCATEYLMMSRLLVGAWSIFSMMDATFNAHRVFMSHAFPDGPLRRTK
jgi:predicted unusual protein kinase regulating ubiquinone biosynthesis (AarF/ABC1/UbiB family)